jgi:hypothetical protein
MCLSYARAPRGWSACNDPLDEIDTDHPHASRGLTAPRGGRSRRRPRLEHDPRGGCRPARRRPRRPTRPSPSFPTGRTGSFCPSSRRAQTLRPSTRCAPSLCPQACGASSFRAQAVGPQARSASTFRAKTLQPFQAGARLAPRRAAAPVESAPTACNASVAPRRSPDAPATALHALSASREPVAPLQALSSRPARQAFAPQLAALAHAISASRAGSTQPSFNAHPTGHAFGP